MSLIIVKTADEDTTLLRTNPLQFKKDLDYHQAEEEEKCKKKKMWMYMHICVKNSPYIPKNPHFSPPRSLFMLLPKIPHQKLPSGNPIF